jgi:hypothetical protein
LELFDACRTLHSFIPFLVDARQVVYGADKQKFGAAMDAVRDIQGERSGSVATLVIERRPLEPL